MKKTEDPIVVEQTFAASPDAVWKAITDATEMRQWFFDNIPEFEPRVGFSTQFDVDTGERVFPHAWRVTEVEPLKRIVYDWRYAGYAGDGYVTWELSAADDSTTLRVTTTVREDFQADIPEFTREACIGGWKYFIQQRLRDYLEP